MHKALVAYSEVLSLSVTGRPTGLLALRNFVQAFMTALRCSIASV